MGRVKALYEYAAREENELSFAEDELLTLLSQLDSDWWLVRNGAGQCGLIPSNYVEEEGGGEQGRPQEQSGAMTISSSEVNIFDTASRTSTSPVSSSSKRAGQTLEEMFPGGVGERRKKWGGELQLEGESKTKGKLHWLPDIGQLVFTSKESGLVLFSQDLTALKTYDRKRGELVCRGATVKLTLGKGDGKELERLISEVAPILPGPINIITQDGCLDGENVEQEPELAYGQGYEREDEHEQQPGEPREPVQHQDDPDTVNHLESRPRVYAQFDYEAQDGDELSLSMGQSVVVLEGEANDDWWLVQDVTDSSKVGLVPQTYLGMGLPAPEGGEINDDQGTAAIRSAIVTLDEQDNCQEVGKEASEEDGEKEDNLALAAPSLDELLAKSQRSLEMAKQIEVVAGAQRGSTSPPPPLSLSAATERNTNSSSTIPPAPPLPPRAEALILRGHREGGQEKEKEMPTDKGQENEGTEHYRTAVPPLPPSSSLSPAESIRMPTLPPPPAPPLPARLEGSKEVNNSATNHKGHRPPPPVPKTVEDGAPGTSDIRRTSVELGRTNLRPVSMTVTPSREPVTVPPTAMKGDRFTAMATADSKGKNPWASITLKRSDSLSSSTSSSRRPRSGAAAAATGALVKASMDMSGLGKALPSRPAKVEPTSNKPNPADTRLWKDKTGQFQTEAAFVSYDASTGVILHKLNGNKVKVPLALLSERDVEYVCRRCGLNVASVKAEIAAAATDKGLPTSSTPAVSSFSGGGGEGTTETFTGKGGFNWLSFLTNDCRLDERAARGIATRLVQTGCEEAWLDSLTKDRLKGRLPELSDSEALLFMQGVTKRRLQRLERLGQEKILQSINSGLPQSNGTAPGTRDGSGSQAHLSVATLTAASARLSAGLPPPLQPTRSPPPPSGRSISFSSSASTQQMHCTGGSLLAPPAAPPRRSLKDVPVLQPASNSLSSVRITPQPVYREFSSSSLLPLANGQLAQQQTTTQYMYRASSSSGPTSGAQVNGNLTTEPTNGILSTGSPPLPSQGGGGPMVGGIRSASLSGGADSAFGGGGPQQWPTGGVASAVPMGGVPPYVAGPYQYQYSHLTPPQPSLGGGGVHQPSGPVMGRPPLTLAQHQHHLAAQPSIITGSAAGPSFGSPSVGTTSHSGWAETFLPQLPQLQYQPSRSGSFQGNQGNPSHPMMSAGVMMGAPSNSVSPAIAGINYQHQQQQQQQVAGAPGDKYAIFKAVDPRSPSLLNGVNPSQLTKPTLHPNNGPVDASGGNFSYQNYYPPSQGGGTQDGSHRPLL